MLVHIGAYHVQRHVTWAFYHHLHIVLPRALGEFAQGVQFAELGSIVGVLQSAWAQTIAQAEGHIVRFHDVANIVKMLV